MKIIITETQYKLLKEEMSEEPNLYLIDLDDDVREINDQDKLEFAYDRFKKLENKFDGIQLRCDFLRLYMFKYRNPEESQKIREIFNKVIEFVGDITGEIEDSYKNFPKLKKVYGVIEFANDLPELEEVTEDLIFSGEKLDKLKKVGRDFKFGIYCTSLPELEYVGGNLDGTRYLEELPNLKKVGKNLIINQFAGKNLDNLEEVGLDMDVEYGGGEKNKIESLSKLKRVGGRLNLLNSNIEDLPELVEVGDYLDLGNTPLSKRLREEGMTEDDVRKKYNVKGKVYL